MSISDKARIDRVYVRTYVSISTMKIASRVTHHLVHHPSPPFAFLEIHPVVVEAALLASLRLFESLPCHLRPRLHYLLSLEEQE
jgi:hypothetical protein